MNRVFSNKTITRGKPLLAAIAAVTLLAVGATQLLASGHGAIKVRNSWGSATGSLSWSGTPLGKIEVTGTLSDQSKQKSNSFLYLSWKEVTQFKKSAETR